MIHNIFGPAVCIVNNKKNNVPSCDLKIHKICKITIAFHHESNSNVNSLIQYKLGAKRCIFVFTGDIEAVNNNSISRMTSCI